MSKSYTKEEWATFTPEQKQIHYDGRRPVINEVLDFVNKASQKKYEINNGLVLFWRDENNEPHGPITWTTFILDNIDALRGSKYENDAKNWLLHDHKL